MTVRPIVQIGDPALRRVADPVPVGEIGARWVQDLVDDLVDTMHDANGAGLAATQIDEPWRIAVMEVTHNPRYPYKPPIPLTIMVNPTLRAIGDESTAINEGCLSVPGLRGEVDRHVEVEVAWHDRVGDAHVARMRGVTAGTFQHECDHLDGRLFLDRVTDPTTFTTWDNYDRHHREAFEQRMHEYVARMGS